MYEANELITHMPLHPINKQWTIQVKTNDGMQFHITDIAFQDIAEAAAKGIQQYATFIKEVRVFNASYKQEEDLPVNREGNRENEI